MVRIVSSSANRSLRLTCSAPRRDVEALRQPALDLLGGQLRQQRLAVGGAVGGEAGADLGDHHQRALRRRMLRDEQYVHAVQHAQVHRLVELARELLEVRPHHGGKVTLGHRQAHDAGAQMQAAGRDVGEDEVLVLERAADAVDGRAGKAGAGDELAERESARRVRRQQPQDGRGASQYLDAVALFPLLVAISVDHASSILTAPIPSPWGTTSRSSFAVPADRIVCHRFHGDRIHGTRRGPVSGPPARAHTQPSLRRTPPQRRPASRPA